MTRLARIAAGLALCTGLGSLAGCTGSEDGSTGGAQGVSTGSYRLVAFDGCDQALQGLRAATKEAAGAYGLLGGGGIAEDRGGIQPPVAAQPNAQAGTRAEAGAKSDPGAPAYSGTNTAEAGVDEPDLVKTDGKRIVTVANGVLRVVDAASRTFTGSVPVTAAFPSTMEQFAYQPDDLLLAGDRALVLLRPAYYAVDGGRGIGDAGVSKVGAMNGPRLVLVDLAGKPRVLSSAEVDGSLVDARQVGSTVRVVVKSQPRIPFDYTVNRPQAEQTVLNRAAIDRAPIDAWLPKVRVTTDGVTRPMAVDCGAISRPEVYSGTSLLTVLTYRLGADSLDDGQPTTLVADGETVYSNGTSLYVTNDQRWRRPVVATDGKVTPGRTEIYKFDTSTSERARFEAGGSVVGHLINQYAMSEWNGKLRVATTTDQGGRGPATQSGVYVLTQSGESLNLLGSVEGLGKGERIYAVRFTGPVGYVVTFRQTDPLYTVDLSDPARPAVKGALKISGYSSYLHPAGDTRVIGIGQDATEQGRVTGTQVSLFDVADLTAPGRLAQYTLPQARSEAEFDPHAFLYWPADGLLVVPMQQGRTNTSGVLVLRVSGPEIREVGFIEVADQVRRSLIIDQTLWTVSNRGLLASDSHTLRRLAYLPFG